MGSKSKIAMDIIEIMPSAPILYDLFCGGGAITHCALLSGKWQTVVMNDIQGDVVQLFADAAAGKFADEKRWISRDDFFRLKDSDAYVRICWSFGNGQKGYLYSKDNEEWKRAYHYAMFNNDAKPFARYGLFIDDIARLPLSNSKYPKMKRRIHSGLKSGNLILSPNNADRLQSYEHLQVLQSFERPQRLQRLQRLQLDYNDVNIEPNSVIYCDIPYNNTADYNVAFDYEKFYDWALRQTNPVYISSYTMPEDFIPIWAKSIQCSMSAIKPVIRQERLFIPRTQISMINELKQTLF